MQNLRNHGKVGTSERGKRAVVAFLVLAATLVGASSSSEEEASKSFILVLDAGHGGKDPGNLGTGRHKTTEKDISLDIVLQVGKLIEENHPEVKVIYTRKGDTFPPLKERVDIANKNQADLFISVHCNANNNKEAYGAETFVMGLHKSEESLQQAMRENASIFLEDNHVTDYAGFDPKNPDTYIALSLRENIFLDKSLGLAKHVQDQFRARVGRKDRGVKQAGYYVISFTNMPSVLVELGFLTNAQEEDFLQSSEGKTYMASAIYRAFKEHRGKETASTQVADQSKGAPVTNSTRELTPTEAMRPLIPYDDLGNQLKFQVQILTSPKALQKNSAQFRGLEKVDEYLSNGTYRYLAGATQQFEEAKKMQQAIRNMGFKDAFIVAMENGNRVDINLAIRKLDSHP
jgi:N-acetylmuramoyl-L-alanine amidase